MKLLGFKFKIGSRFRIIPAGTESIFIIEFKAMPELCLWELPLSQCARVIDASAPV